MFRTLKKEIVGETDIREVNWGAKRVAVVGAGRSGFAAAKLLKELGANVCIIDSAFERVSEEVAHWAKKAKCKLELGKHSLEQFEGIDAIAPSPGVRISCLKPFLGKSVQVFSETELAWAQLTNEKVIGITGTSGKTTTASLCGAMLSEQRTSSFVGGNIGRPLSEYILGGNKVEVVVLELSSFQLQTCKAFRPDVAAVLNISPNHLDYHANMEEYIDSKMRICRAQGSSDIIVVKSEMDRLLTEYKVKAKRLLYQDTGVFASTRLLGSHNRENAEAAWAACREFGVTIEAAKRAVERFQPLEHRLEFVRTLRGVSYVNDSKASTVEALSAALKSFEQPVFLLAGGVFKGGDLERLRPLIKERVRAVGLFGENREVFEKAWGDLVLTRWDKTLEEALKNISRIAGSGDVVLLSPATSSFDQYANYMERGKDFKRIVNEGLS